MIWREKFVMAHKPYAIDLDSVRIESHKERDGKFFVSGSCDAVWFRKKNGVVRVCWGPLKLWAHYMDEAADISSPQEFLGTDFDGRYGGECNARWDGTRYWGSQNPDVIRFDLDGLKPMLEGFPQVPEGLSGWWSFR